MIHVRRSLMLEVHQIWENYIPWDPHAAFTTMVKYFPFWPLAKAVWDTEFEKAMDWCKHFIWWRMHRSGCMCFFHLRHASSGCEHGSGEKSKKRGLLPGLSEFSLMLAQFLLRSASLVFRNKWRRESWGVRHLVYVRKPLGRHTAQNFNRNVTVKYSSFRWRPLQSISAEIASYGRNNPLWVAVLVKN